MVNTIEYKKAKEDMLQSCSNWDNESKALIEAFNQGIDWAKNYDTEGEAEK